MMSPADAHYRLKLATGFLEESRQDIALGRWRSSVDNSQLAVENAAKAVLALIAPVGKTHHPATPLRQALQDALFPHEQQSHILRLVGLAETLGFDIHVQTDYGDELEGVTPWELFDQEDAQNALNAAVEAIGLARMVVEEITS